MERLVDVTLRAGRRSHLTGHSHLVADARRGRLGLRQRLATARPVTGVELRIRDAFVRIPELRRQLEGLAERGLGFWESAGSEQPLAERVLRVRLLWQDAGVLGEGGNRALGVALSEGGVAQQVLRAPAFGFIAVAFVSSCTASA